MKINKLMFDTMIDHIALLHDCSITSGRRTPKRNNQVGGLLASRHLAGMAADLVPDDPAQIAPVIATAKKLGLDAIYHRDHIHVEADQRTD